MMKLEILEEFSASNDQMIVKGKRTKRSRPSSSTSSNGGAAEFYNPFVSSPATSSAISTSTEEDEDMANCLILLARGINSPPQSEDIKTTTATAAPAAESKFSSRKFAEMATTAAGKVGIYVYECKTCNRTFPSFQALGGHRASHKRPKTAADVDQRKSPPAAAPPDDQEEEGEGHFRKSTPPAATQSPNKTAFHSDPNKPKMHECSICGSEFGSGQALGGHMRRHRPAPPPSTGARIATASVDNNITTSTSHEGEEKARNMLSLDLNLPAPPEDEKPQPPHVVFSAAALVDCHY